MVFDILFSNSPIYLFKMKIIIFQILMLCVKSALQNHQITNYCSLKLCHAPNYLEILLNSLKEQRRLS